MRWLADIKQQLEAQACLSLMTKLTPDDAYGGMYYAVHPDYFNRLIEIADKAEWFFLCPSGRRYCEFCGGQKPGTEPTGLANAFFDHLPTCPYSDEWVKR